MHFFQFGLSARMYALLKWTLAANFLMQTKATLPKTEQQKQNKPPYAN